MKKYLIAIFIIISLLFIVKISSSSQHLEFDIRSYYNIDDNITIRFLQPVGSNKIDNIEENVSIKPNIPGEFRWRNAYTLEFKNKKSLLDPGSYSIIINGKKIIDGGTKQKQTFKVLPLKVEEIRWDVDPINKEFADVNIEIITSSSINSIDLEKAFRAKIDNKTYPIKLVETNWRSVKIKIPRVKRSLSKQTLSFDIIKEHFYTGKDIEKKILIPQSNIFFFQTITPFTKDKTIGAYLKFSTNLDEMQNFENSIKVAPHVNNLRYSVTKNQLKITGNFKRNKKYYIDIATTILGKEGEKIEEPVKSDFMIKSEQPRVIFSENGTFISRENLNKVRFRSINVKNIQVLIYKVFHENINHYLLTEYLRNSADNKESLNQIQKYGKVINNSKISLTTKPDSWQQNEVDLSQLLDKDNTGLYFVALNITKNTSNTPYYKNLNYNKQNYLRADAIKPVFASDIAMTMKQDKEKIIVYATDIVTGKPVKRAKIRIYSKANQIVREAITNSSGKVELSIPEESFTLIEAEYNSQLSFVFKESMEWNTSTFDVSGKRLMNNSERISMDAFLYCERDIYRPGDTIYTSLIIRNNDGTVPDQIPVNIRLYDPQRNIIVQKNINDGKSGFYDIAFPLSPSAMTGDYEIIANFGNTNTQKSIKVDTFIPDKMDVSINTSKSTYYAQTKDIEVETKAKFLFGAPASDLKYDMKTFITASNLDFKRFSSFNFEDPTFDFKATENNVRSAILDSLGNDSFTYSLPKRSSKFENLPNKMRIKFQNTVQEKGGETSNGREFIDFYPYTHYVGVQTKNSTLNMGDNKVEFIVIDALGNPVQGKEVNIDVFHNSRYWWWEYYSWNRTRFKEHDSTTLVHREKATSGKDAKMFTLPIDKWGQYHIEFSILDDNGNEHKSIIRRSTAYRNNNHNTLTNTGKIILESDKPTYNPGDLAKIYFDAPDNSKILVSLEKGNEILQTKWENYKKDKDKKYIEVPIKNDMYPNIYVSLSIIQPQENMDNDLPIRQFSVIPLTVVSEETKLDFEVTLPDVIKPNTGLNIEIQAKPYEKTQFTLAVVDEGILRKTFFETPKPWKFFYQKITNVVRTFDNFTHFLGNPRGDIEKSFSIGGGMNAESLAMLGDLAAGIDQQLAERFKPFSIFEGVLETDETGKAIVPIEVPEYYGAVRVMVVGANKKRFGSFSKIVPVKSDLIMSTSIPRTIKPRDKFSVGLEIFPQTEETKDLELEMNVSDKFKVHSQLPEKIYVTETSQMLWIELEAKDDIGLGEIEFIAKNSEESFKTKTNLSIIPANSVTANNKIALIGAKKSKEFEVDETYLKNTFKSSIEFSLIENLGFGSRLQYLIKYPYGCVEQTTSAVLPQLYLKDLMNLPKSKRKEIDKNINTAIKNLQKYQTNDGGFSYWARGRNSGEWNSSYVGMFLVLAKQKGYAVPDQMIRNWLRYQKNTSRRWRSSTRSFEQTFRLLTLALAEKSKNSELNSLKDENLDSMSNTEKWMLAAAYYLSGSKKTADFIIDSVSEKEDIFSYDYRTYGGHFRNRALILFAQSLMNDSKEDLAQDLCSTISSRRWMSTQDLGFGISAIANHYTVKFKNKNVIISYEINGKKKEVNLKKAITMINLPLKNNEKIKIQNEYGKQNVFVSFNYEGIPTNSLLETNINGFELERTFYDENGSVIDISQLEQGEEAFCIIKARSHTKQHDVALAQVIPSGWEINTEEMNNVEDSEFLQKTARLQSFGREKYNNDYKDVRDDRIYWFFDLGYEEKEFGFKFRAMYKGEYTLPSTYIEAMYDGTKNATLKGQKVEVK